jgi:UDP-3-O-acyl N-acetylglucosamine deacetylase
MTLISQPTRPQNTIQQIVEVRGFGLFSGQPTRIRFLPADENQGIRFQRSDLPGLPIVAGHIRHLVSENRRTVLANNAARVEMTEHVMAALAGLHIDNCLVQINNIEPPSCDGSSLEMTRSLMQAGLQPQAARKISLQPASPIKIEGKDGVWIEWLPAAKNETHTLTMQYDLSYGPGADIPEQSACLKVTPKVFVNQIAPARTFIQEREIEWLRSQGFGTNTTTSDLLIFGPQGVIGNTVRFPDECARHKILDCIGDLSLCGFDLTGKIIAHKSGHALNHQLAKVIVDMMSATGVVTNTMSSSQHQSPPTDGKSKAA